MPLEGVSFAYPKTSRPELCEVSFQVAPGELVALVGPTGAGKTTVTYLLARFWGPTARTIRVDGHDLRGIKLESLSQNFGIVFLDTFLFHASIRENLLYARPEASQRVIEAACLHGAAAEGSDVRVGYAWRTIAGRIVADRLLEAGVAGAPIIS